MSLANFDSKDSSVDWILISISSRDMNSKVIVAIVVG